jgi:hypothetical protein
VQEKKGRVVVYDVLYLLIRLSIAGFSVASVNLEWLQTYFCIANNFSIRSMAMLAKVCGLVQTILFPIPIDQG